MQVTVKLREMFHYSLYPSLFFLGLFLGTILIFLGISFKKKKEQKKPVPTILKDPNAIKQKYLQKLEQLKNLLQNKTISSRKGYQELSKYIRKFIFELTNIKVQNYSLEEIKQLNIPILYELVKDYYRPEFARKSEGNILEAIEKASEVIRKWN